MQRAAKYLAWRSTQYVSNEASEMLRCALHDNDLSLVKIYRYLLRYGPGLAGEHVALGHLRLGKRVVYIHFYAAFGHAG